MAVPLAYAASILAEGDPPRAEACVPPWLTMAPGLNSLHVWESDITVGRDGFFAFAASGFGVNAATALRALDVEVHHAAGEVVPGEVQVLLTFEHEQPESSQFWLSWLARDTLAPGARLGLRISIRGSNPLVSHEGTLTVSDETAVLALPHFELGDWHGLIADTGPKLTCTPSSPGWCFPIEFGTGVERLLGAVVRADDFPEPPVAAFWEYTVSEVPGKGTLAEPPGPFTLINNGEPDAVYFYPRFRGELDEYCLKVSVRDLRTDESLSATHCASPPASVDEVNSDPIMNCLTVPTEYLSRWCEGRGPSFDPSCPDASAGGSSGMGGNDAVVTAGTGVSLAGSSGMRAGAGGTSVAGAPAEEGEDDGSRSVLTEAGCGCRTAPSGQPRGALAFTGLLAFAAAFALRRRRASYLRPQES
jgi:MYXO-CTERM domain-containing protein